MSKHHDLNIFVNKLNKKKSSNFLDWSPNPQCGSHIGCHEIYTSITGMNSDLHTGITELKKAILSTKI